MHLAAHDHPGGHHNGVAMISDAAQAQKQSEAELVVAQDMKVVLADVNDGNADVARKLGDNAFFVQHGVSDKTTWTKVVSSAVVVLLCMVLGSCDSAQEGQVRPVNVVRVHRQVAGQIVYGTGEIRARYDTALGFLLGGRIIERSAEVGKSVKAGEVLARLEQCPSVLSGA